MPQTYKLSRDAASLCMDLQNHCCNVTNVVCYVNRETPKERISYFKIEVAVLGSINVGLQVLFT